MLGQAGEHVRECAAHNPGMMEGMMFTRLMMMMLVMSYECTGYYIGCIDICCLWLLLCLCSPFVVHNM